MSEISGKWYQSLFWLLIVCTVARTISNGEGDGRLYTLLWFVNILATVVYGAVLLKMEHFSAHFRMAGFCKAASAVVGVLFSGWQPVGHSYHSGGHCISRCGYSRRVPGICGTC